MSGSSSNLLLGGGGGGVSSVIMGPGMTSLATSLSMSSSISSMSSSSSLSSSTMIPSQPSLLSQSMASLPTIPVPTPQLTHSQIWEQHFYNFSPIEVKDEFDEKLCRAYSFLHNIFNNNKMSDLQAHEEIYKMASQNINYYEDITMGYIVSIMLDQVNAQKYFRDIITITRDGWNCFNCILNHIIVEKYFRLHEYPRVMLLWLLKELLRTQTAGVDMIYMNIFRNIIGGDLTPKNLWLSESLLDILIEHLQYYEMNRELLSFAVYNYLRLIVDHTTVPVLRLKEVQYCNGLLLGHFSKLIWIGRDLVRLLQHVTPIPEFERFWKDSLLTNPGNLAHGFTGIVQLMKTRTPRRFLKLRITHEMEKKLNFFLSSVRFGRQPRYQEWFQKQYFSTPESQMLRTDVIRFICCCIHPSNEIIASDVLSRWATIGWLLNNCTSNVAAAYSKLALYYDWLFFDALDVNNNSVMDIEPGILIITLSLRSYPNISSTLLDFLCRISKEFYPAYSNLVRQGIKNALYHVREKRVVMPVTLANLFESPKIDFELRQMLRENFPEFVAEQQQAQQQPSSGMGPQQQSSILVQSGAGSGVLQRPPPSSVSSQIVMPPSSAFCPPGQVPPGMIGGQYIGGSLPMDGSLPASALSHPGLHHQFMPIVTSPSDLLSSSSSSNKSFVPSSSSLCASFSDDEDDLVPSPSNLPLSSSSNSQSSSSLSSTTSSVASLTGPSAPKKLKKSKSFNGNNPPLQQQSQSHHSNLLNSPITSSSTDDLGTATTTSVLIAGGIVANNNNNSSASEQDFINKIINNNNNNGNRNYLSSSSSNSSVPSNLSSSNLAPATTIVLNSSNSLPFSISSISNFGESGGANNATSPFDLLQSSNLNSNNKNGANIILYNNNSSNNSSDNNNSSSSISSSSYDNNIVESLLNCGPNQPPIGLSPAVTSSAELQMIGDNCHVNNLNSGDLSNVNSIVHNSCSTLTSNELLEQIEHFPNIAMRSYLLKLHEETNREIRCQLIESLIKLLMEDEGSGKSDDEEDREEFYTTLTVLLLQILESEISKRSIFPFRTSKPYSATSPDESELMESINGPLFVMFREMCAEDDDGDDDVPNRLALRNLIAQMGTNSSEIGYLLIYYLVVTKRTEGRIQIYRDYIRLMGKELQPAIHNDLRSCAKHDVHMFGYLVPVFFANFFSQVGNNAEILYLVLSNADAVQMQSFVGHLLCGTFRFFRKDGVMNILNASLEWDTIEQLFLWKILEAQNTPIEQIISILPKLVYNTHSELLTGLMLYLNREAPTTLLIKHLLNREPKPGDNFTVSILLNWADNHSDKLCQLIGNFFSSKISSPNKNTRNKRNMSQTSKTSANHTTNVENFLIYLEQMRVMSKNMNFLTQKGMMDVIRQLRQHCTSGQKTKYEDLFDLCSESEDEPSEDDEKNDKTSSGSQSSTGNSSGSTTTTNTSTTTTSTTTRKGGNSKKGNKRNNNNTNNSNSNNNNNNNDSETESESSGDDVPQSKGRSIASTRKKRKQPIASDSD